MSVGIRVDGSTDIGSGHVMRCLALAEVLRSRGEQVTFLSRALPGAPLDRIRERDFAVVIVPELAPSDDARFCVDAVGGTRTFIVDHYGLDARWERGIQGDGRRLLVIDDLADRPHCGDLLLDSSFPGSRARYQDLAGDAAELLGPAFALMSEDFVNARARGIDPDLVEPRLLCFFGGTDLPNLSGQVLEALSAPDLRDVPVDLVIGSANPHAADLRTSAAQRGGVRVHHVQPSLAPLMAQCAWAVGAGGVTTYERLCLGLPSLVVSIAQNQVESCTALAEAGLIDYVGHVDPFRPGSVRIDQRLLIDRLLELRRDLGSARQQVSWGMGLVDGLGAHRAAEALIASPRSVVSLRPATMTDAALFFRWANDPEVRANAWHQEPITWVEHEAWFALRMADPRTRMFVLMAQQVPVGQVRFEQQVTDDARGRGVPAGAWVLDYSVEAFARGRGWSSLLLRDALAGLPSGAIAWAEVRPGNVASVRALGAAGWQRRAGGPVDRVVFEAHVSR